MAALTAGLLRWAVVVMDLDPSRGHEQGGTGRALVVSYEAFHRSGTATVCPITTRLPKYVGEVQIPGGHAGQIKDGLILCHQVRTLDLQRVTAFEVGGRGQFVTDRAVRQAVRSALQHQLGLDCRHRWTEQRPTEPATSCSCACGSTPHASASRVGTGMSRDLQIVLEKGRGLEPGLQPDQASSETAVPEAAER